MNCQEQAAVAIRAGEGGISAARCYAYRGHDVSCPYTSKGEEHSQEWLCRENQQMPGFPVKATGTRKTCPGRTVGTPGKGNRDAERAPHKRGKARRYKGWTKKRRWRPKG